MEGQAIAGAMQRRLLVRPTRSPELFARPVRRTRVLRGPKKLHRGGGPGGHSLPSRGGVGFNMAV